MASRSATQLVRLTSALISQARLTSLWLNTLTRHDFAKPSVAESWTILDLTGHLLFIGTQLNETLDSPTTERPVGLHVHLRTLGLATTRMVELVRRTVGREDGPTLARQFARSVAECESRLRSALPPVVVHWGEPVRITDFLRATIVDLVTHSDDLSQSLPERPPLTLDRAALAAATRTLAEAMAQEHPGQAIELRVPPSAAVQLSVGGLGSTHTRGTPPSVVETDALTFLRLCSGRNDWDDSVARNAVAASGAHADIARLFPRTPL